MKKKFTLAALLLLNFSNPLAQGLDTTQWFPYKTGDMWEYYVVENLIVVDTFQIFNEKDSILPDGKIYLTQRERFINPTNEGVIQNYLIDTSMKKVYGYNIFLDSLESYLLYDFKAKKGEQWVIFNYNFGGGSWDYEMARVVAIYPDLFFGMPTTIMDMNYYLAFDSTDTTGLDRYTASIGKGLGLTLRGYGDVFYSLHLKGCVINGILYGDTTNIIVSVVDHINDIIPDDIILFQNYPNPFNPSTIISYQTPTDNFVTLKVFDVLGREVAELVNTYKEAGIHSVEFNASKISSGIYSYKIQIGNYIETRKLILQK